ncbi:MAG: M23 family metallopeptidase, partial [Gemmatimonadales bacterium]
TLDFPLRGIWTALRTPAPGGPGHGTDFLGQRHAYDFVRPTGRVWSPYGASALVHAYGLVPATAFAAWDAPVLAAESGRVVVALDGWPDRRWMNAAWELARLRFGGRIRPLHITSTNWRPLAGNYILLQGAAGITMYAHLRNGSICVRIGEEVSAGQILGTVGNSGRSSMPHLHFHLMDRPDGLQARGIPCVFRDLERRDGSNWVAEIGIPAARRCLRHVVPAPSRPR